VVAARLIGVSHGHVRFGIVLLTVDIPALERQLDDRLVDVMETIVPRRRGRPRGQRRRT
jgi:hypothetical protein